MNIKNSKLIKRIMFYIIRLFCLALGVAVSISSKSGVSPVNALPYIVSLITGKDIGTSVIGIFSLYLLIQILILRKEFKWINLTQLVFSTIFGYFVGFTKFILGDIVGIREGTILCAILVGKVMKRMQKAIMPMIEKICF